MTIRGLARGSILITLANLIPRAGTFLLLPLYTRFLTTADFGLVSIASSGALLLALVYRLGLDAAALRMHHELTPSDRRDLYTTVIVMSAGVALAVTGVAILVGLTIIDAATRTAFGAAALLALGIAAFNTFQYVPSTWLRATDQTGRYLGLALLAFLAVASVSVLLVVIVPLGAIGSLAGQLSGALVVAVGAAVIAWRQRPWRIRFDLARQALRFGLPLLPHSLAGWLLNVSDRWLLGLLLGVAAGELLGAIGIYSLGYQLGYAVGLAAISFNAAWLPFLYRIGTRPGSAPVLRESTTLVVIGFTGIAALLAIFAADLVEWLAPPAWSAAADVTVVVAFASAANAAGLMYASGMYLDRRTGVMPILTAAAAATNLAVNVVLIPRIGIMGAAWATLIAYAVLAASLAVVARRRDVSSVDIAPSLVVVGFAVAITIVSRAVPWLPVGVLGWHLVLAIVLVSGIGWVALRTVSRLEVALRTASSPEESLR